MKGRRTASSLATLVSLILLYILLIVLVLVFASQVLGDLSFSRSSAGIALVVLAVVFPLILLAFIGANVLRLIHERTSGRPGSRFKARLLVFFAVVVALASVPQAVLSVNFIRATTDAWFSAETGDAIRGAQEITIAFFRQRQEELTRFLESRYLPGLLEGVGSQPARVWERVQGLNPAIDSMQVFDPLYNELFFAGPGEFRISAETAALTQAGQITRESISGESFIRGGTSYTDGSESGTYAVMFTTRLPGGFDSLAGRLADSLEFFVQLELFQNNFITAIAVLYGVFSVPLMLLSVLVSFFLSDEIIRPIVRLEEATRKLAEGDFSIRILSRRGDELSTLVDSFNRMINELERTRTEMIKTEKIAAWQEIAQRLAHEIKNPLTPIRLAAERSLRKYETQSPDFETVFRNSVKSIVGEVESLNSLLTEFREFSRLPAPNIEEVKLRPLVDEVAAMYGQRQRHTVDTEGVDQEFTVLADPGQLKQVLVNLCKNALEAMPDGGEIHVAADVVTKGESVYSRIRVEDTGPGILPEYQDTVFSPYVTTKRHGTGLGLAIVERIAFDHHGQIWFDTEPGFGTTFYLDIPRGPARDTERRK
jgi:nitrogen fixation/metabolism regulation signal transduction histidine kinase